MTTPTETPSAAADARPTEPGPVAPSRSWVRVLLVLIIPVLVLGAVTFMVASNGDRILSGFGHNPPPADELVVERTEFRPGRIELHVVNPQPEELSVAYVTVDAAIANEVRFEGGDRSIGSRERRTLVVPYDWIADDPYLIGIVSSTGITTDIEVPAAVPAQEITSSGLGWGALVGVLVGFIPVALGLAWLPALRQLSEQLLGAFLAFTAGLLTFLAVDAAAEAFDTQAGLIPAFGGPGVVVMGIVVSMVALGMVGRALRHGAKAASGSAALSGATLALLVAIGIGLHNLGEGLAIGSSFATGEASLAIALVIGFMVHNLTEGVGIAAPLARDGQRLGIMRGLGLALLAGMPAVLGIWMGRYLGGALFTTLCFAIAAGAALQVVVEVVRSLRSRAGFTWTSPYLQVGFAGGILVMWLTGILAG